MGKGPVDSVDSTQALTSNTTHSIRTYDLRTCSMGSRNAGVVLQGPPVPMSKRGQNKQKSGVDTSLLTAVVWQMRQSVKAYR